MEAKNFRIGNLIDTINRGSEVHLPANYPMKIFEISTFEVLAYKPDEHPTTLKTMPVIGLQDVCGLNLTEEWLVKLGFTSNPYEDRYEIEDFYIQCDKTKGFLDLWITNCRLDLKHVHQLQNVFFALTGNELELKHESSTCG